MPTSGVHGHPTLKRVGLTLLVLVVLWALWEGYKWIGEATGSDVAVHGRTTGRCRTWHDIVGQLFEPSRRNGSRC